MAPSTPTVQTPNPTQVGNTWTQFLNQLYSSAPGQFQQQQTYQPEYANLQNSTANTALTGSGGTPGFLEQFLGTVMPSVAGATTSTVAGSGAPTAAAVGSISPETMGLLNLGQGTAMTNLESAATGVLPANQADATLNAVNQNWASRGLGGTPPNQLDAALNYYNNAQGNLTSAENVATTATNTGFNDVTSPVLSLLSGALPTPGTSLNVANTGQGIAGNAASGPSLYSNADAESLLNLVYNAQAGANINQANVDESQNALKEEFWSSVIGAGGSAAGGGGSASC